MIAYPVSRYLAQFGAKEATEADDAVAVTMQPLVPSLHKVEEPRESLEELLEAAQEKGRIEGRLTAQTAHDAQLAAQQLDHEKHIEESRAAWISEESAKFELHLTDAIAKLEACVAESVDAVLRPFLIESLRRQMIDELVIGINVLLANDETPSIEISGAADFIDALRQRLSAAAVAVDYKPDESIDVKIVAHHTVIESQLRAWIERFDPSRE